jgi:hypothetical protein
LTVEFAALAVFVVAACFEIFLIASTHLAHSYQ